LRNRDGTRSDGVYYSPTWLHGEPPDYLLNLTRTSSKITLYAFLSRMLRLLLGRSCGGGGDDVALSTLLVGADAAQNDLVAATKQAEGEG